ncbi:MAG: type II secretion system protein [Chthoniobacteraceae bacterium]
MHPRPSHYCPTARAFTLIELLAVIVIIAVLMALLFPVLSEMKHRARRTEAATTLGGIVSASKNYYNDYGNYPRVSTALDGDFYSFGDITNGGCKANNSDLFDILRKISRGPNTDHKLNQRQQLYYSGPRAQDTKNPRSGFCDGSDFGGGKEGQLMDPWGAQYCVVLDATGEEEISMGSFYSDLAGSTNVVRQSPVAFSLGRDNKRGGTGYENRFRKPGSSEAPDDIVSWRQ